MRTSYRPGQWIVFRYDLERLYAPGTDPAVAVPTELLTQLGSRGRLDEQPFLIGPAGRPDARINRFFTSRLMRARSPLTWRKYAYSLGVWLNFLLAIGRSWDDASEDDADHFKEWRLTHEANPQPVETITFAGNLAALRSFYRWASREYGVHDPVAATQGVDLRPRDARSRDIKWLDPAGYRRWRDLGLRGLDLGGREDRNWRGRNGQRDAAFADGLYGSGLRLTEWASMLLLELADDDPARGFRTCRLVDACAKGGYGHKFWLPRTALLATLDYVEGARARAVRRAQDDGRYRQLVGLRRVVEVRGERLSVVEADGRQTTPSVTAIGPRGRRRLFRETPEGLEPMALWLNEDGLPRDPHGWQHTFEQANERIARLGLVGFTCAPHMLRHSCALRWYAVGRLAYEHRFGHLDEQESKDFRVQFGDTWNLVATMLGHRNPQTTRDHYLEPFRGLDIELLLEHARHASVDGFLSAYLADHPQVRTDPLRGAW